MKRKWMARTAVVLVSAWGLVWATVFARPEESFPVHRFFDAPHAYYQRVPRDGFSRFLERVKAGEWEAGAGDEKSQLRLVLDALQVPLESQLLVYSATSLQSGLIVPSNPRALYFNDEIYVGYVPGGRLEVAAIDPELGPVFYLVHTQGGSRLEAARSERCMNCHAGRASWRLPGLVAESVVPTLTGASLDGFRRDVTGHTLALKDRLGGWHVTGAHENGPHLGNLLGEAAPGGYRTVANPPGKRFDWGKYPVKSSDLLAHLLHEHQIGFHNLVTLALYRTRDALEAGSGSVRNEDRATLDEIAWRLVRYVLFQNEAALPPGGVQPDPAFVKAFEARRIAGPSRASLRDFDLRTRLFRYRCSYMIHTPGFVALPREMKQRVFAALNLALQEKGGPVEFDYLPADEKRAIRTILRETRVGE
jgi:hypothetical protein